MNKKTFGAQRWLFPLPAFLVGSLVEGKPNYMTAAWCGMVNSEPPTLAVGLRRERHTLKGIVEHNVFSINVPSVKQVAEVDYVGIYTGNKTDKSEVFKSFYGVLEKAPLAEECPVNLECTLVGQFELETHRVLFGRIEETHVSESCLVDGNPTISKVDPIIWSPSDNAYFGIGEYVAEAFRVGKSLKK